ncbi:hypothetical protein MLD38_036246 [Melastoma candidum]|uniref:Uncharacterized protein n=1 Tax=Melastoma candidum TaxID=119954 RepID=A0ACB9LIZ9_9MYRT|nr:hypothetical protein MLD38_036246 [Melastoma candidum]
MVVRQKASGSRRSTHLFFVEITYLSPWSSTTSTPPKYFLLPRRGCGVIMAGWMLTSTHSWFVRTQNSDLLPCCIPGNTSLFSSSSMIFIFCAIVDGNVM